MEDAQAGAFKYLRLFSYLLIICGAFGVAVGVAVLYGAFADAGGPEGLSLGTLVLGASALVVNGLTGACGVAGRVASANPARLGRLRTLALAGIVGAVLGLGLCHVTGAGLPTSLIFSLLLMAICLAVENNLAKSSQ